jgi:ubiquinone biosynthesis UbiH/UbiF/VisC/COQ6 family hydroxylase
MQFDIAIVGAGPAGLATALAIARSGTGHSVALLERAPRAALAMPAFDGREIALSHHAVRVLHDLGAWDRLPQAEIAPLAEARVSNGRSPLSLRFAPPRRAGEPLGHFAPNHRLRQALFEAAMAEPSITLLDETELAELRTTADAAELRLADGRTATARLAVAADSRFSALRRAQGIGAFMRDYGKTMLVCRVAHERPHGAVAMEWFGHGITVAMLPLPGDMSGAVVTLPTPEAQRLMAMDDCAFAEALAARIGAHPPAARLGALRPVATRHAYPLVGVYAHRFAATRLALAGDAAVGMHPVTAHGFNFALRGAERLAREISKGGDPGAPATLARYARGHRADTWPLFAATDAIAQLYTDDRLPARVAREALIGLGAVLSPVRRLIAARLMHAGAALPARAA